MNESSNHGAAPWTGDARRRFVVGFVVSLLALIASSWSHVRGGGSADGMVQLAPLLIVVPVVAISMARRSWSFRGQIAALVLLQPAVHVLMSRHLPGAPGASSMTMSGAQHAPMHHGAAASWSMPAMHVAIVVILTLTLRYGWRWISTMPTLLAAVVAGARAAAPCPVTPTLATLLTPVRLTPSRGPSTIHPARGPPR